MTPRESAAHHALRALHRERRVDPDDFDRRHLEILERCFGDRAIPDGFGGLGVRAEHETKRDSAQAVAGSRAGRTTLAETAAGPRVGGRQRAGRKGGMG